MRDDQADLRSSPCFYRVLLRTVCLSQGFYQIIHLGKPSWSLPNS